MPEPEVVPTPAPGPGAPTNGAPTAPRPPTAALPPSRTLAREVSNVPPAPVGLDLDGAGVAARIVPADAAPRRRTREQLLGATTLASRLTALVLGFVVQPPLAALRAEGAGGPDFRVTREMLAMLAVCLAITAIRRIRPADSWRQVGVEVALVMPMVALTGGFDGPLNWFGVATAFAVGASSGLAAGLTTSTLFVAAGIAELTNWFQSLSQVFKGEVLLVWSLLAPLAAVVGSLVAGVLVHNRGGHAALLETNRVLGDLQRLTSAAPEALSPAAVATAAAREFRRALAGDHALVLFERHGALVELGRDGDGDLGPHVLLDTGWDDLVRGTRMRQVDAGSFPVRLTRQLPATPAWVAVPLRAREHRVGVVLVGGERVRETRALRQRVHDLAEETAVAVDNTQLFSTIEQSAATAERQRLARDLHDGVAQQLTHVRFELELLARSADQEAGRRELARLARVAQRATEDVRSAIRGLRAQALDEGLVPALRSLVNDLSGAQGPAIELDVRGAVEIDPDTAAELYRITQEALSNALRHADAEVITVEMDVVDGTLLLVVEDDGQGLPGSGGAGDGLGLRTMRARAGRLGAEFSLREAEDGGTRVEIRMPLAPTHNFDEPGQDDPA